MRAKSGVPGNPFLCLRNLTFSDRKSFAIASSGFVPLPLILDINRLLSAGLIRSRVLLETRNFTITCFENLFFNYASPRDCFAILLRKMDVTTYIGAGWQPTFLRSRRIFRPRPEGLKPPNQIAKPTFFCRPKLCLEISIFHFYLLDKRSHPL